MNSKKHWNQIYSSQTPDNVGWYKPHLETSLAWIEELNLNPHEPIIDKNLTVLDLSKTAIQVTQKRLGNSSNAVTWLVGDVTEIELPSQYYLLWHDRAVYHFLIEPESQQK